MSFLKYGILYKNQVCSIQQNKEQVGSAEPFVRI